MASSSCAPTMMLSLVNARSTSRCAMVGTLYLARPRSAPSLSVYSFTGSLVVDLPASKSHYPTTFWSHGSLRHLCFSSTPSLVQRSRKSCVLHSHSAGNCFFLLTSVARLTSSDDGLSVYFRSRHHISSRSAIRNQSKFSVRTLSVEL